MDGCRRSWSVEVSRRSLLQAAAYAAGAVPILTVTANRAMAAKASQSSVAYRDTPNGDKTCANCALFQPPDACRNVEGKVSPQGWCRIWVKKSS